jgi:hypothetical protein
MSVARWSEDSDLYLYCCTEDPLTFECCQCHLFGQTTFVKGLKQTYEHLWQHMDAGHKVPRDAFWLLAETALGR